MNKFKTSGCYNYCAQIHIL